MDDEMDVFTTDCPACHAINGGDAVLGTWGANLHLRCRFCGMGWMESAESEEALEVEPC